MPTSQARIDANKRNSTHSTGPRTTAGRDRSRRNGLVHGMCSSALTISTENARDFEDRMDHVCDTLNPRNARERMLAESTGRSMWLLARTDRAQTARLTILIEEEAVRAQEAVISLGKRLFFDRRGPEALYGCDDFHHVGDRTSFSGAADHADDPDTLVRRMRRSVEGCQFLLDRWAELRALLEPGKCWQPHHKLRAVRLLGHQPLDALASLDVAQIYVRSWTINPKRETPWSELKSELGPDEYRRFKSRVHSQWPDLLNSYDDAKERQVLIEIVERAVQEIAVNAQEAAKRAERDAALRADALSFDDSHEGELLRRYQTANHRAFLRSLSEFDKARRATEDEGDDQRDSGDGNAESEVGPSDDWLSPRPSDVSEEIDPALTTVSTTTTGDDRAIDSNVPTGPVDSNFTTAPFPTIDSDGTTSMANMEKSTSIARGFLPTEPNDPIESALNNPYTTQAGIEPHDPDVHRAEVVPVRSDLPDCGNKAPVERLPAAIALVVSIALLICCSALAAVSDRRAPTHNRDGMGRVDSSAHAVPQPASSDVAPLGRPEGAFTNQPRATPGNTFAKREQPPGPASTSLGGSRQILCEGGALVRKRLAEEHNDHCRRTQRHIFAKCDKRTQSSVSGGYYTTTRALGRYG